MSRMSSFGPAVVVLFCLFQQIRTESICCPGIVPCFTDDPPFNGRPLPECPEDLGIVMKVYTKRNPTDGQPITRNSIPSVFKGEIETMFVVHGWRGDEDLPWMHRIKDAVLDQNDYNVIVVGWKVGSHDLFYIQAVSNTRTAGAEIALVSKLIIDKGKSSRSRQYCVGFSLGSHVCGHAGHFGQFGRITGLDPAGPLFRNRDWKCGLNPSCADLVDVIHTNGAMLGAGMMKPLGHIDFYPNGGKRQPGCPIDLIKSDFLNSHNNTFDKEERGTVIDQIGCSHTRAVELFIESIRTPCFLSRYTCKSQIDLPEDCKYEWNAVQSLGFNANASPNRGIFYLPTNAKSPFCRR